MPAAEDLATRVRQSLRIGERDDAGLADAAAAVVAMVSDWHGDPDDWDARIESGAQLLTARIWRRRQSPAGVESVGELGAVYVQRRDPDVAMLLGLGTWRKPMVG